MVSVNREQRRLVRALRPAPVYRPSFGRALAGWLWRHLPELLALVVALRVWHWSTSRIGSHETTAAGVLLLLVGAAVSQVGRWAAAVGWCWVTRHRLHTGLIEVRATNRDGRLPLFLAVMPAPFGERVWLWCRAGISAEDLEDEVERLRAALWCRDLRVLRSPRTAALVTVEVIRRDPLATKQPIGSELLDGADVSGEDA